MNILPTDAERRSHPRFAALSPALVVGEAGMVCPCLVEDLSGGGACITGAPGLVVGEMVRLLLQLPGRRPFSLDGRVVRRLPDAGPAARFGLSFARMTGPAVRSLDDTVASLQLDRLQGDALVLVVNGSTRSCATLVHDLHGMGHRAIGVTTCLDAIEWLLDGGGHIATALVDQVLGDGPGIELLTFLADEYPQVHRVLLCDPLRPLHPGAADDPYPASVLLPRPWARAQLQAALHLTGRLSPAECPPERTVLPAAATLQPKT